MTRAAAGQSINSAPVAEELQWAEFPLACAECGTRREAGMLSAVKESRIYGSRRASEFRR